jgi:hypothetical protein
MQCVKKKSEKLNLAVLFKTNTYKHRQASTNKQMQQR